MLRFSAFGHGGGPLALALATLAACGSSQVGAPAAPASAGNDAGALVQGAEADGGAASAITSMGLSDEETTAGQDKEEIDDGAETADSEARGQILRHPLDNWSKEQIEGALAKDPDSLGSMSIGYAHSGALFNGVQMPPGDGWELVNADHAWGTRETVDNLTRCLKRVVELFPGAPTMYIGHISGRRGGHLSPHKSHQCGRDVDLSYYYVAGQEKWYAMATSGNLDRERTWAFIRTLITDTDVELILMDRSVQRLVRQFAIARGEDREWVDRLFDGGGGLPPLIRHAKGHATHLHVRFYNPLAQETGRRAYEILIKRRVLQPPSYFVRHKAKSGDTLSWLALKYHVPAKVIQQTNGLKTDALKIDREYRIPQSGGVRLAPRVTIPARRLPPETAPVPVPVPVPNAAQKGITPPAALGGS
ncbi:MAG TPA: penicillin-insensitive murein endopeptidase [Polyangiaceae bacterium]|nr:penicillin-insensitive murein endopeptidase [Polyangiaceae bacterium]